MTSLPKAKDVEGGGKGGGLTITASKEGVECNTAAPKEEVDCEVGVD